MARSTEKYVDFTGLSAYDTLLKKWVHICGYYKADNDTFYTDAACTAGNEIKKYVGNLYINLGSETRDLYRYYKDGDVLKSEMVSKSESGVSLTLGYYGADGKFHKDSPTGEEIPGNEKSIFVDIGSRNKDIYRCYLDGTVYKYAILSDNDVMVSGYYNTADGQFYEDSAFTPSKKLTPNVKFFYINEGSVTKDIYRWNSTLATPAYEMISKSASATFMVLGYYYGNKFYEDEAHEHEITPDSKYLYIDKGSSPNFDAYRYSTDTSTYCVVSDNNIVVEGYYNATEGKFYKEAAFTTLITPNRKYIYVDLGSTTKDIYRCGASDVYFKVSAGDATLVVGYYNATDKKFYEDAAFTEAKLITADAKNIYVDLGSDSKDVYRWNAAAATPAYEMVSDNAVVNYGYLLSDGKFHKTTEATSEVIPANRKHLYIDLASKDIYRYNDTATPEAYEIISAGGAGGHVVGYKKPGVDEFYEDAAFTPEKKITLDVKYLYIDLGSEAKDIYRCYLDGTALKLEKVSDGLNLVLGYLKKSETNPQFYKEDTFTTLITGKVKDIYVDLGSDNLDLYRCEIAGDPAVTSYHVISDNGILKVGYLLSDGKFHKTSELTSDVLPENEKYLYVDKGTATNDIYRCYLDGTTYKYEKISAAGVPGGHVICYRNPADGKFYRSWSATGGFTDLITFTSSDLNYLFIDCYSDSRDVYRIYSDGTEFKAEIVSDNAVVDYGYFIDGEFRKTDEATGEALPHNRKHVYVDLKSSSRDIYRWNDGLATPAYEMISMGGGHVIGYLNPDDQTFYNNYDPAATPVFSNPITPDVKYLYINLLSDLKDIYRCYLDGTVYKYQLVSDNFIIRAGYLRADGEFYKDEATATVPYLHDVKYLYINEGSTTRDIYRWNSSLGTAGAYEMVSVGGGHVIGYYNASEDKFYTTYDETTHTFSDPITGDTKYLYVDLLSRNKDTYRFDGTGYKIVSDNNIVVEGYYSAGTFYEEQAHATAIVPQSKFIYVDLESTTKDIYRWMMDGTTLKYVKVSAGDAALVIGYYNVADKKFYENYDPAATPAFTGLITADAKNLYIDLLSSTRDAYRWNAAAATPAYEMISVGGGHIVGYKKPGLDEFYRNYDETVDPPVFSNLIDPDVKYLYVDLLAENRDIYRCYLDGTDYKYEEVSENRVIYEGYYDVANDKFFKGDLTSGVELPKNLKYLYVDLNSDEKDLYRWNGTGFYMVSQGHAYLTGYKNGEKFYETYTAPSTYENPVRDDLRCLYVDLGSKNKDLYRCVESTTSATGYEYLMVSNNSIIIEGYLLSDGNFHETSDLTSATYEANIKYLYVNKSVPTFDLYRYDGAAFYQITAGVVVYGYLNSADLEHFYLNYDGTVDPPVFSNPVTPDARAIYVDKLGSDKDLYRYNDAATPKVFERIALDKIKDVTVASVSVVDAADGIAKILVATDTVYGVVKVKDTFGISKNADNQLITVGASTDEIKDQLDEYKVITPSRLKYAIKYGLGEYNGTDFTDAQKLKARETIGAHGAIAVEIDL